MNGWCNQIDRGQPLERPKGVIGIVVAQAFPEPELIREKLVEGISRVQPGTVWVMRDAPRAKHAAQVAWDTFKEFEIEAIQAPLVPAWKLPGGADLRASQRDIEMRYTCERIIVFHDKSSGVTSEWVKYRDNGMSYAKIFVVERGKKKAAKRKGRKPTGV